MRKYLIGDLISQIKNKSYDLISKYLFWKLSIGEIGKNSFIKRGVKIQGNRRRIKIGSDFKIWDNCFIAIGNGEVLLGSNGLLGVNTYINASEGKIVIGDNVAIAPFCQIYSYSHHYFSGLTVSKSHRSSDVIIEDDVLIGANSVILPGVRIGKCSIIGAGSVIISSVEPYSIVGGVPAKFIKSRKP